MNSSRLRLSTIADVHAYRYDSSDTEENICDDALIVDFQCVPLKVRISKEDLLNMHQVWSNMVVASFSGCDVTVKSLLPHMT